MIWFPVSSTASPRHDVMLQCLPIPRIFTSPFRCRQRPTSAPLPPAVSPFRRIRGGDDRHGVPHGSSIVRGGNVAGQGLLSLLGSYRNEHILKAKRCHRGIRGPQTNYTSKVLSERVSWILERETSIKLWWLIQGLYHTMNFIANAEFI